MTGAPDMAVIVGAVIAVLGGVRVFSYLASGSNRRHQCRWLPVGISHVTRSPFGPVETAVLDRCSRRGEFRAKTLVGKWTFAQLLGADDGAGTAAEDVAG